MNYPAHDPQNPVVAFDFDDVLARGTWPSPSLGRPNYDAIDAVNHYYDAGCQVVIFTARPTSHLQAIREWVHKNGLGSIIYEVTNRKPVACLYFDDRAVRWPL
jgi:hypothetical protein